MYEDLDSIIEPTPKGFIIKQPSSTKDHIIMAEEITETVKKVSSGSVKITIEEYQDLLAKAAEKAPVIYRTVQKTPAIVAGENKMWGTVLVGGGVGMALLGGFVLRTGIQQSKAL